MRITLALCLVISATSGCALLDRSAPSPTPAAASAPVLGEGASVAALDTTTDAQKAAALAAPATPGARDLGQVSVSLGSPTEPGIWLRSALVSDAGKGRVVTADGQSVAVDLLPGQGAAQLSLAAYLALGLSLTDLPQVTVFAD